MKRQLINLLLLLVLVACKKESSNESTPIGEGVVTNFEPLELEIGKQLLEDIQGHWVGINQVIGIDYEWFTFDYRPISSSHVFGLYEGGTFGNLFTSFFVADFKGTKTVMARNGGILGDLYRTSYFVMDSVSVSGSESFYRLVDAKGGKGVMYMELRFTGDSLYFNAYTSRLGLNGMPSRHMTFKGVQRDLSFANTASSVLNFPDEAVELDMSEGFKANHLYKLDGEDSAMSATYMYQGSGSVESLAAWSGDPFTISDHSYLGKIDLEIEVPNALESKKKLLFLSKEPLTDDQGSSIAANFESVLLFPELIENSNEFLFTYIHPGTYYLTVIADMDGSQSFSGGDKMSLSKKIEVESGKKLKVIVNDIEYEN